jgi:hypothetical protein
VKPGLLKGSYGKEKNLGRIGKLAGHIVVI